MKFGLISSQKKKNKILLSDYQLRYLEDKNKIKILFEENQRLKSLLKTNEDLNNKVKILIEENQKLKSLLEAEDDLSLIKKDDIIISEDINKMNKGFFLNIYL